MADHAGRYHLLGFDLDAGHGPVLEDLPVLLDLLRRAGVPSPVVCQSGPHGGHHVWVRLARPAPAELVRATALALRGVLVSLDPTPLLNPATGCLRPPGARHRIRGRSVVVAGQLETLHGDHGGGPEVLNALLALVGTSTAIAPANRAERPLRRLPRDADGHRYLPGRREALPPSAQHALMSPVGADTDASAVLWRVLLGAVRARWRLADLRALLPDRRQAPGLEHARTARHGRARSPRVRHEQRRRLAHQWERAVTHVLERCEETLLGDDPSFDERLRHAVAVVDVTQARAAACPGRWARSGGATDRRVLDALCLLALEAVTTTVDIDIRRLAEMSGVHRETARRCLWRLCADGWISQARAAAGPAAASWSLADPFHRSGQVLSTEDPAPSASQADSRPARTPAPARRSAWVRTLRSRLDDQVHDVFTPSPGLGQHAGRVYAAVTALPVDVQQLHALLGYEARRLDALLERLITHGLIGAVGSRWVRRPGDMRRLALGLGVGGTLQRRRIRHGIERDLWAWWLQELSWMRAPRARKGRDTSPGPGQQQLELPGVRVGRGRHPRRANGRADYAAAARRLHEHAAAALAA